jgi:hypothetical protein
MSVMCFGGYVALELWAYKNIKILKHEICCTAAYMTDHSSVNWVTTFTAPQTMTEPLPQWQPQLHHDVKQVLHFNTNIDESISDEETVRYTLL